MINAAKAEAALKTAERLFSIQEVEAALDRLAASMSNALENLDPIILCVMNGGVILTAALLSRWNFSLQFDYLHVTRYRNTTQAETLQWVSAPRMNLNGRVVVIVDDILDEGVTLAEIKQECHRLGANKVYSAVLVEKKRQRDLTVDVDYKALYVDDHYVFGYGMDYAGYLRNAPGIFALKE